MCSSQAQIDDMSRRLAEQEEVIQSLCRAVLGMATPREQACIQEHIQFGDWKKQEQQAGNL